MDRSADIAIVGAGVVGLAHAYMALRKGYRVVLFEKDEYAVGASIRNFGLIWPIGQEPGVGLDRALRARAHWMNVSKQAGFWMNTNGSLHLAYHDDEWSVLNEFIELYKDASYDCKLLLPDGVTQKSSVVNRNGLKGGLWSATEGTVYSRDAIRKIPLWLEKQFGLILRFGNTVTEVVLPSVTTSREKWKVEQVFICSGTDFQTLYPAWFDKYPITKCKLQMMKAVTKTPVSIGPSLCAGLTLRHYAAFGKCPSLRKMDARYDAENYLFKEHGIHVLLAQNEQGELIIGDSHHYNKTIEPFDSEMINDQILKYLSSFTNLGELSITERWHGVYAKLPGSLDLVIQPEPGVTIVNALSGAGMTLSFGLAEELIDKL